MACAERMQPAAKPTTIRETAHFSKAFMAFPELRPVAYPVNPKGGNLRRFRPSRAVQMLNRNNLINAIPRCRI